MLEAWDVRRLSANDLAWSMHQRSSAIRLKLGSPRKHALQARVGPHLRPQTTRHEAYSPHNGPEWPRVFSNWLAKCSSTEPPTSVAL